LRHTQRKPLVTLRFADPKYLIVFSNGIVATADDFTDDMAALLQNETATIIFLEDLAKVEQDGSLMEIPDMDDIEWN